MAKNDVREACRDAIQDPYAVQANPTWLPPSLGGKGEVVSRLRKDDALDIRANMERISYEADPIGFLMAVMMGVPVPVFNVQEDGTIVSKLETAGLKDRLLIARFLGDRVVPKMSVNMNLTPPDAEGSFLDVVRQAADKADD